MRQMWLEGCRDFSVLTVILVAHATDLSARCRFYCDLQNYNYSSLLQSLCDSCAL